MSRLGDFIAFRAALELLKLTGREQVINDIYERAKEEQQKPDTEMVNLVQEIYAPFTDKEISDQIAVMLKTPEIKADLEIVFQSVEGLHKACPGHTGDWYFTGNYPTPGGNRVVTRAFVNYIEGHGGRAY